MVVLVGAVGTAGCGDVGSDRKSLADIKSKALWLNRIADADGLLSAQLSGEGSPLLIPGTVEATLNGHPMIVDPGDRFSFDEFYWSPLFKIQAPDDLGSTLTLVIKDSTQTLRAVISGRHPHLPVLESPPPQPRVVHRGDQFVVPFTAPDEPPDLASASFSVDDGIHAEGSPCHLYPDAPPATILNGQIESRVPTDICISTAFAWVCAGYSALPRLETCENATCLFEPSTARACTNYSLVVSW
jgi:hypothetical protein